MAAPWFTLPTQVPANGQTCWVRLNYWFGQPFQAKWDEGEQTFVAVPGEVFRYPFWSISRWRPV